MTKGAKNKCEVDEPVPRSKKWWKESDLQKFVEGLKFPSGLDDLAILKKCYYNFYNMYLASQYPESGWRVHRVLFPVITGLWKNERKTKLSSRYFPSSEFSGKGCFRLGPMTTCLSTLPEENKYDARYLGNFADEANNFRNAVEEVLESWDTTEPVTRKVIAFQNMTAMLALTLLRGMILNELQLTRSFREKHFISSLHTLTRWPRTNGYVPPHKLCITHCCRYFDKREKCVSRMFAMILFRWRSEALSSTINTTAQSIIERGLLNRTKLNGLGLVKLTFNAKIATGTKFEKICETTLNRKCAKTWRYVSRFMKKYIDREDLGCTVYWARLVDDEFLQIFTAKSDPYYAGIMAGLVANQQPGNNVQKAFWFKNSPILAESGFKLGQAITRYWKDNTKEPQSPNDSKENSEQ